jgi:hypothetical protein
VPQKDICLLGSRFHLNGCTSRSRPSTSNSTRSKPLAAALATCDLRPATTTTAVDKTYRHFTGLPRPAQLQDESRCPTRRDHHGSRSVVRPRHASSQAQPRRLLPHAVPEPARHCRRGPRVPDHIRVHRHHVSHPEDGPLTVRVLRLGHPRRQPQLDPARAASGLYRPPLVQGIGRRHDRKWTRRPCRQPVGAQREEGQEHAGQPVDIGLWEAAAGVDWSQG